MNINNNIEGIKERLEEHNFDSTLGVGENGVGFLSAKEIKDNEQKKVDIMIAKNIIEKLRGMIESLGLSNELEYKKLLRGLDAIIYKNSSQGIIRKPYLKLEAIESSEEELKKFKDALENFIARANL